MNFVSVEFLIFLLISLLGFTVCPARWRKYWLLFISYVFYGSWNLWFLLVLVLTTTIDYWMAKRIASSPKPSVRKIALSIGLISNLGVLFFFKYTNFMLQNWHGVLSYFHLQPIVPAHLDIVLPLGISFFTFEAISYLMDVYRGEQPSPNWLEYNFYILYFPHLISGPIIRFKELYPQYEHSIALPSLQRIAQGVELVLLGFIFKVFLADTAAGLVDSVFQNPVQASVMSTYLAVLGFTVQIYFDFLGYTHIARGISLLFNIALPVNFNHPYLAYSLSDFWQRWHISLSRWIRDYLYIPMGGSRGNLSKTVVNLLATMVICGAWHGAGWPFLIWGLWHGLLLALEHFYQALIHPNWRFLQGRCLTFPGGGIKLALTFVAVVIGWVLFRSENASTAYSILDKLIRFKKLWLEIASAPSAELNHFIIQLFCLLSACFMGPWLIRLISNAYRPLPFWGKSVVASSVLLFAYLWTAHASKTFIYFQF